jgi:hypothetical protein
MRVRHKPLLAHAVTWDDTREALRELVALGMAAYDFTPTIGDTRRTLVIHTAEGEEHVFPGWAAVLADDIPGFRSVPPDTLEAAYEVLS